MVIISGDTVLDQYRHSSLLIFDTVWLCVIRGSLSFGLWTAPAIDRHESNHFINITSILSKGICSRPSVQVSSRAAIRLNFGRLRSHATHLSFADSERCLPAMATDVCFSIREKENNGKRCSKTGLQLQ